jgi:hypothetical protein
MAIGATYSARDAAIARAAEARRRGVEEEKKKM